MSAQKRPYPDDVQLSLSDRLRQRREEAIEEQDRKLKEESEKQEREHAEFLEAIDTMAEKVAHKHCQDIEAMLVQSAEHNCRKKRGALWVTFRVATSSNEVERTVVVESLYAPGAKILKLTPGWAKVVERYRGRVYDTVSFFQSTFADKFAEALYLEGSRCTIVDNHDDDRYTVEVSFDW